MEKKKMNLKLTKHQVGRIVVDELKDLYEDAIVGDDDICFNIVEILKVYMTISEYNEWNESL